MGRRLPDSRPGAAGGTADWQVRHHAAQLSAGLSYRRLRWDAIQRNSESAPGAGGSGSQRDGGTADHPNGQSRGRHGSPQSSDPIEWVSRKNNI